MSTTWAGPTMASSVLLQQFAAWCIDQAGKPVLWDAKGDYYYDAAGVKVFLPAGQHVFDCSGLVTSGVKAVGGQDLRDVYNAQKMADTAPQLDLGDAPPGSLGFYGADWQHVNHVVVALAGGHLVSADGATHAIRSLSDAIAKGCQVRVHTSFDYRRDEPFLGWRPNTLFDVKGA